MKLYSYDHCPYCVRARMIFGFKKLPFEYQILLNDDEETPIHLIGKKVLPILIKPDGTAMGESLAIVEYIDAYVGGEQLDPKVRPEVQAWLQRVSEYHNYLGMPRATRMDLDEFATQSAIDYFTRKKTEIVGDFSENIKNTPQLLTRLHEDLPKLALLIHSPDALNNKLGMEDILTFPVLRGLTMVKGVQWPDRIRAYLDNMSKETNVALYDDRAI